MCKDTIKERLLDTLGAADRAASQRIGSATYAVLYAVASSLLAAGTSFVVESNFRRGTSDRELAPLIRRARAIFIHCSVSDGERRRRYAARDRHPGHFDGALLAAWESDVTVFGPPALDGLVVNEADGAAPTAETVAAVMRALTAMSRSQ